MNKPSPLTPKQLEACIAALNQAAIKTIGEGIAFEQINHETARDASLRRLRQLEQKKRVLKLRLEALQPCSESRWHSQAAEWLR